ncbi:DNA methyltransferase [Thioalkalivibrio sp. ALMg11]|uniref:DNA methyltransferase n=1 Tax=Thioalkalivibrio sp. ALMg11 TaxID=1158165 RepID=UPI00038080CE|nr:site-specific DNA-methyltransferase [Thioalkalivibrio sp. ALMg11]
MTNREKFQALLRELFQFDCADLDFGIYRIMNYKRDVIEKFISTDLPELIGEELNRDALADQSQAAAELAETAEEIAKTLGKDALDADGNLVRFQGTEIGKKYLSLQAKAAGGRGCEALEATIFNHLYTFFSRYYQDGDFISKRRYSRRQKYAIPYNGEEVYLHWANQDQYYVKTAEHFHDYTFTSQGVTVHFKLTAANVEQNNVKGEKRFFLPRVKSTDWLEEANELVIPFEYRPLTDQEKATYTTKSQQEKIIAEACEAIPEALKKAKKALSAIIAERRKDSENRPITFLEHHLRQYTRKNTSDFFIHRNLKVFLSRELDFYLKNEVMSLDEIEAAGEDRSEGWFQVLRVIKAVGGRIIDFLDQIESFQKMLWEKRKFVTETQYCITASAIDESFYPDIAACDAQWDEWKELFRIGEEQADLFTSDEKKQERRVAFLKEHPTLVIDTSHFEQNFNDKLLESFGDLDDNIDGIMLHSENWQALNFIAPKFGKQIECQYIDPNYNTEKDVFPYKDGYKRSTWLTMMEQRVQLARQLLKDYGFFYCSIDEHETSRLRELGERIFGQECFAAELIWNTQHSQQSGLFTPYHEYVQVFCTHSPKTYENFSGKPGEIVAGAMKKVSSANPASDFEFPAGTPWYATDGKELKGEWGDTEVVKLIQGEMICEAQKLKYPVTLRAGWTQKRQMEKYFSGKRPVFDSKGQEVTGFYFNGSGKLKITKQRSKSTPSTLLPQFGTTSQSTAALEHVLGEAVFGRPKPVSMIEHLVSLSLPEGSEGTVADFFAGSGTTGHAVINLNRRDGGRRRFILVEMGQYFDSAIVPRMKKVTFAPEWDGGKPSRMATAEEADRSPRIVKFIRLESYEDALNNIKFHEVSSGAALEFDDYLLKYMLAWESRHSETLLNVEQLAKPFSYKLTVAKGDETIERTVDIPETFNFLLGLHVSRRKVCDDEGRRYLVYQGHIDHRRIAVIWREMESWQKNDLERDKEFVAEQKLAEGADEVFVNGDSFIPNAKALEPVFKARMFAPVEA